MTEVIATAEDSLRIAVVGDLHTHFDAFDIHMLNQRACDLLFFTGDLGGGSRQSCLEMARLISSLRGTVLVMPGNNDTVDIRQLASELTHRGGQNAIMAIARKRQNESNVALCGYSLHRIVLGNRQVSLIAARPHSMGGPELTFPEYMAETYSIHSLEDSVARMKALVDQADEEIIFLAHNGPHGLGGESADIWGCDFMPDGGDWGDTDLAETVQYARAAGKRVLAVVAGHMHLRTKQGVERPWHVTRDGTDYINAARVPRIFSTSSGVFRHHVLLTLRADGLSVEEVLLSDDA